MLLFLVASNASEQVRDRASGALWRAAGFVANLDHKGMALHASASGRTLVVTVGHPDAVSSPRTYRAEGLDELVLFDGLPLYPDGGLVLDARRLGERWADARRLEGAGTALRADLAGDRVEVVVGPLGLLPVFACAAPGGGHLLSNSVLALRLLAGLEDPDPLGVSSMLALGWAVGDRTMTAGIRALPGGSFTTLSAHGLAIDEGAGVRNGHAAMSPGELAERLVESARGLSVLGDRIECPLTAGRDSRLCLAVLRAAGVAARCYTLSSTGDVDVRVAAALAAAHGLPHRIEHLDALWAADPGRLARAFVFQTDGLSSFEQIADQPSQLEPVTGLGVKVSGIGGEIARAGFAPIMGPAAVVRPLNDVWGLQRRLLALKAHAPDGVVRRGAVGRTRRHLREFADARRATGWPAHATGQAFYALERVGRWGSTGVRRAAATADLFSPFFSGAFITAALAQTGSEWVLERLHHRLMSELDPALRDARYAERWAPQRGRVAGAYAAAGSARAVASGLRRLGPGGGGLRASTAGSVAAAWVGRCAPVHLELVDAARGGALEEYIDLAALRRVLSSSRAPDNSTLRALSAVWWFQGLDGAPS